MGRAAATASPRRLLRFAARAALALGAVFAALVLLLLAAANSPWGRVFIAREASELVSGQIAGTLIITRLGRVGFGSASGIDAELRDAEGQPVLGVSSVEAELDVLRAARSLLGDGPLELEFTRMAAGTISVDLRTTSSGALALLGAVEPASERPPPAAQPEAGASLELSVEALRLRAIQLHGGPLAGAEVKLMDVAAHGRVAAGEARFELEHLTLEAHGLPVVGALSGELSASGEAPLEGEWLDELMADARFRGIVAELPVESALAFARGHLSGFVRSEATSEALRGLWPEAGAAAGADAEAVQLLLSFEGPLDALRLRVVIESGGGDVYVDGQIDLYDVSGRATLLAERLNAARWVARAPATSLRFVAALAFRAGSGAPTARLALRSEPSRIGDQPLPALSLSARLASGRLEAQLVPQLPGGEVRIDAAMPLGEAGARRRLELELHATVSELGRTLAALGWASPLSGRGTLQARGTLELSGEPSLSGARLRADLRQVGAGGATAARATLDASAHGALDRLQIDARLDARRLSLPSYSLERLRARASGSSERLQLRAELEPARAPAIQLRATLRPAAATLTEIRLAAGAGADSVRASARRVSITPGGFRLDGLEVRGVGRLELDAAQSGEALDVRAEARAFSPQAVARRLGFEQPLPHGVADLSLRLQRRRGRLSGALSGKIAELELGRLRATLRADVVAEKGIASGTLTLAAAPVGQVLLSVEALELPTRWTPAALADVEGQLELRAVAELEPLTQGSGLEALARANLAGQLEARLLLDADGAEPARARLALVTRGLSGTLPGGGVAPPASLAGSSWRGVDVELGLELNGARLSGNAALLDSQRRAIAALRGSTSLPLAGMLRHPASFDAGELPLDIRLDIPERELGDFPPPLRFAGVQGALRARFEAEGVLGRPALTAHAELSRLRLEEGRAVLPLDIVVDAGLRGDQLSANARIQDARRKLVSLEASATVGAGEARLRDMALELRSNGLPLDAIGALIGQDLAGDLYGALSLGTRGGTPAAEGTLWVNEPSWRGFRQARARLALEARAGEFATELRLEQREGEARLSLGGPWQWPAAGWPRLDRRALRAELYARGFDLRALAPLVPDAAGALGGRLDAELTLDPARPVAVEGRARLREGRVYVAALGQEFRDIALDARSDSTGRIAIERLTASALRGRLEARGAVELEGLALETAELNVTVPRRDPLPLAVEGVTVASAWGRLKVTARAEPGPTPVVNVHVSVPRLQVVLPELSPRSVQALGDDPTIATGTFIAPDRFIALPLPPYESGEPEPPGEPLLVRIDVDLGDEVWVEQEPMLEVKLAGGVEVELEDELAIDGQLRLERGSIEVQGRTFQIESGTITFDDRREPTNPTVVASGVYTAPEGTRVYAEFVGPVETGKLTLRSEPPLRDDQILSLLLFGSSDGSFGASSGDAAADPWSSVEGTALVAGGNVVARGLNLELRRLTTLDIQTRIGQREGQPQPEVAVQLSPRLTAELAYRLEAPTPGRAPDRTYLTLDLRLFRNWSLSTTIGDAGSFVLDLLWRHRY